MTVSMTLASDGRLSMFGWAGETKRSQVRLELCLLGCLMNLSVSRSGLATPLTNTLKTGTRSALGDSASSLSARVSHSLMITFFPPMMQLATSLTSSTSILLASRISNNSFPHQKQTNICVQISIMIEI